MKIARRSRATVLPQGLIVLCAAMGSAPGQAPAAQTPQALLAAVIANENAAAARHDRYEYISNERSGRTGGHLWTERVVETAAGRVRLLLAEDGRPLSPERSLQERERLAQIEAHPEVFIRHEQNTRAEEKRAREMMEALPNNFLFENVRLANGLWTMSFRPNPDYSPSGIEERILHNMAGRLSIDARDLRLMHLEFYLTRDLPIGFGLLADIHKGTNFVSDRQVIDGRWHTMHVATQVHAKAVLFKSVDLNLELSRSQFVPLDHDVTVPEAAAMLLK
jgi:hypothetical protein